MEKTLVTKDYATFLERLRAERRSRGISQQLLAEKLGESQSFISKCERGERRLDVVELRLWCEALGSNFSSFTAGLELALSTKPR